jgi:hypothetical protein
MDADHPRLTVVPSLGNCLLWLRQGVATPELVSELEHAETEVHAPLLSRLGRVQWTTLLKPVDKTIHGPTEQGNVLQTG